MLAWIISRLERRVLGTVCVCGVIGRRLPPCVLRVRRVSGEWVGGALELPEQLLQLLRAAKGRVRLRRPREGFPLPLLTACERGT